MKDDIAFYLLEKPLVPKYAIEIASESDIAFIKQNKLDSFWKDNIFK